jgi:cell pole-organizing protein PopZ
MSDQNAQEPTMEEILASIRRIISEDDAAAESPADVAEADDAPTPPRTTPPEAQPEPASAPVAAAPQPAPVEPTAAEEDDVLELTDPLGSAAVETHGDLEIYPSEPAPAAFEPAPAPAFVPPPKTEGSLLSDVAARASASAFGSLHAAVAMPPSGLTLDEVVRELLKPLLASWLDEHLPRIVEAKVEEEVQRIARR